MNQIEYGEKRLDLTDRRFVVIFRSFRQSDVSPLDVIIYSSVLRQSPAIITSQSRPENVTGNLKHIPKESNPSTTLNLFNEETK